MTTVVSAMTILKGNHSLKRGASYDVFSYAGSGHLYLSKCDEVTCRGGYSCQWDTCYFYSTAEVENIHKHSKGKKRLADTINKAFSVVKSKKDMPDLGLQIMKDFMIRILDLLQDGVKSKTISPEEAGYVLRRCDDIQVYFKKKLETLKT